MDAAFNRFVHVLKRNGVRISPSESIDGMQALRWVSPVDRETVKTALRTSLIKDLHDLAVFDELFELFFAMPTRTAQPPGHGHDHHHGGEQAEPDRVVFDEEERGIPAGDGEHAHGEPVPIRDYFEPEMMVTRFNPHQDPNQLSLEALSQGLILNRSKGLLERAMQRVTHQINVRRVKNIGNPGDLNFGDGFLHLDEDLVVNAAEALLDDLREMEVDEGLIAELARRIDGIIVNLPELLKRYIEREMALRGRDPQPEPVVSAYGYRFSESERRQMEEIIRRLGRRMRGARSYRSVVTHRGRIQVARTLCSSMVYDGIPFKPVLTGHRNDRPRMVLICDVSLSVRNTARFTLHLVYRLQSLFEQVRSFVFVSDLADASACFERQSIDDAIATIFSGEFVDCDANSNYGRALQIFTQHHLSAITSQTTVIILGDGRGNRNPPHVAALEEIRRRAKQLIWLSPEPRGSWGLGSSDMPLYAPVCHRAEVVRNLAQLGEVVDSLIRRHKAAAHA
ncbi:MAG: VWA domain-containing protein [Rhodospirillales bacterium]